MMLKQAMTLVYFGFQQPSRNSIRHHRYSSRIVVCSLNPTYHFLFSYISCTLLEDMIDVDITEHTLKGIHTFKDRSTHTSKCSPWGMKVRQFPSLSKMMRDYIEERQATANPFSNRSYSSRPNPSPFWKWPKATPAKKRAIVTKCNIKNFQHPRNVNMGYYSPAFKQN